MMRFAPTRPTGWLTLAMGLVLLTACERTPREGLQEWTPKDHDQSELLAKQNQGQGPQPKAPKQAPKAANIRRKNISRSKK